MKFVKGMIVGTMVSAGVLMMWVDTKNTKNITAIIDKYI